MLGKRKFYKRMFLSPKSVALIGYTVCW